MKSCPNGCVVFGDGPPSVFKHCFVCGAELKVSAVPVGGGNTFGKAWIVERLSKRRWRPAHNHCYASKALADEARKRLAGATIGKFRVAKYVRDER